MILAFVVKQAGSLIWFPRGFPRDCSGKLCWLASLSRGRFGFLRGNSARPRTWVSTRCSVMLRFWHGPGPHRWLVFKAESPADRRALEGAVAKAGSVASRSSREFRDSRDVQAMFQEFQERERAHLARRFKLSILDIAHRRLVQSERR